MRHQYGYEAAPMSPEFGYELVNALNAPNGKGEKLLSEILKILIEIQNQFQALNCLPSAGRRLKSGSLKELFTHQQQLHLLLQLCPRLPMSVSSECKTT